LSSKSAAENFGFEYCTTDYKKVLSDGKIDAVVIATRNSLHASLTIEALENGKHVFVEKPLAINKEELDDIIDVHNKHLEQVIQVGFNRRYAPMTKKIKEFFKDRKEPMILRRANHGLSRSFVISLISADMWLVLRL
jgi:predicted dehydrogenase